ncbi:S-layer homology domain-containing protein [Ureibacillus aquaedulcis]|uniref:S-layer homology domain-containing protein n=1 Tax=Ureibacillus aquaedulcis TaxID=3058421 RepID=A0ABT8GLP8_9BACL|nr:S-layer homology domain-containing protein [Ureibacillus sp. BA0131]MDN4492164.1 S-layer homology domain-containing protein [Ureibacillus sp. BA0131]
MSKQHKLFATAATAALVASAIVPVASAAQLNDADSIPSWAKEAVQSLVDSGAVQGDNNNNFNPFNNLTRAQAAEILSKVKDLQAVGTEDFSDVKAGDWFYNAVLATSPEIFNGNEKGEFKPSNNLTRQEAAKVLVSAFGLTGSTSLAAFPDASKAGKWAVKALETAVANDVINGKGSLLAPTDNITNAEFATMVKRAADAASTETSVVSVSAVNAKTIEVKFNNAVDADTLKAISVVEGEGAADAGTISQELSEDGKTLTLTAEKIFKGDYTVKVPFEIVKDVEGNFVNPINAKVTANDKTAPVLTGATSKIKDTKDGLKEITLEFDEEVVSIDTVKINGVNYSAKAAGHTATVAVDLDATKSYNVTVVNATDAAGNVKDVQQTAVKVDVDNVAPSIVSVVPAGENKVTVTLDEELKGDSLAITGKVGTFTANVVSDVKVNANNKKEYTVTLNSGYLFKNGNSDSVTLTVAKEALSDALGNKNASEITKTVVVSKDATAPSVVDVETATTDGKVTSFAVTYNEEVKVANGLTGVKVVNSKGEILSVSDVVSSVAVSDKDAKTVVFTLDTDVATDAYSFELPEGFVVDTALTPNKTAKSAFDVNVTEAGKPVETSFDIVGAVAANNVITVDFGAKVKATGTGSALNASAYQVNGVTLPSDTEIKFATAAGVTDQSKVVITLPDGFVKADDAKAIFRVNAVQTLDNKVSNQFSKLITVTDNTAPELTSFVATDLTAITVSYSEAVKVASTNETLNDITDELALVDGNGAAINFELEEVTTDGKLVLTVDDSTKVASITTLETSDIADITDLNDVAQKTKVTVSK